MKKYVVPALLSLQLFTPTTLRAQNDKDYSGNYLCIADAAGGVRFDEASKNWVPAKFTSGDRYILSLKAGSLEDNGFNEISMTYFITFEPHGSNYDNFMKSCWTKSNALRKINPFMNFAPGGFVSCDLVNGDLKINFENLRFLSTYTSGFVDGYDNGGNTPFVQIGTCSKI